MIRLADIARWSGGRLVGPDTSVAGVSTDTRTLADGQLFVALRGEHHDGAAFVADAVARGAAALLVEQPVALDIPQVVVADALQALGQVAAGFRAAHPATVIGITGSNGKTTVRMLLAAILGGHAPVHATAGNFNNEIGLPLTVLAMPKDTRFAVLEMGAGKPGDIEWLARIARPKVAVVTNVAAAHLQRMGSLEGVADTKAALYRLLPADGVAVINADDAFAGYFRAQAGTRRCIDFGMRADAAVHALPANGSNAFRLCTPQGAADVHLALQGRHNVMNALAAAAAALALDVPLPTIVAGLEQAAPVAGRQSILAHPSGATIIDDSYNANPSSFDAAIDVLAARPGRTVLVMGDMGELGAQELALHARVGEQARTHGVDRLLAIGPRSEHAVAAFGPGASHHPDHAALAAELAGELKAGATILIKGSRAAAMERVVEILMNQPAQARGDGHVA